MSPPRDNPRSLVIRVVLVLLIVPALSAHAWRAAAQWKGPEAKGLRLRMESTPDLRRLRLSLRLDPMRGDTWYEIGKAELENAQESGHRGVQADFGEEALMAFRQTVARIPCHHGAWFHIGWIRAERGDRTGALQALEESLRRSPDDAWTHELCARLLLREGRLAEAVSEIQRAARSNARAMGRLLPVLIRRTKASRLLRNAIPDQLDARNIAANILYANGIHDLTAELDRRLLSDGNAHFAYAERAARRLAEMGFVDEGLEALLRYPGSPAEQLRGKAMAVSILTKAGRTEDAIELLEPLAASDPSGGLSVLLAQLYSRQGNSERAIRLLEEFVEGHPASFDVRGELGRLYSKAGDWTKALRHAKRAAALRPDSTQACLQLAQMYRKLGLLPAAEETLRDGIGTVSSPLQLWRHVAQVYRELGMASKEAEAYREILRLSPDDPTARSRLEALESGSGR